MTNQTSKSHKKEYDSSGNENHYEEYIFPKQSNKGSKISTLNEIYEEEINSTIK